jgi:hypothetical protein
VESGAAAAEKLDAYVRLHVNPAARCKAYHAKTLIEVRAIGQSAEVGAKLPLRWESL